MDLDYRRFRQPAAVPHLGDVPEAPLCHFLLLFPGNLKHQTAIGVEDEAGSEKVVSRRILVVSVGIKNASLHHPHQSPLTPTHLVRVELLGHVPVGPLDISVAGALVNPQDLVVVLA